MKDEFGRMNNKNHRPLGDPVGDCSYIALDELLDDLCKEIEYNDYIVSNVEIE